MKKFILLLAVVGFSHVLVAQNGLPAVPQKNKCYALCTTEDEFRDEEVKVLVRPAYKKLEILPAEYKEETEEVVIKPASKKYTYVPAKYKTVKDTLWIKDGYNKLATEEASFVDDVEVIETKASYDRYATTGQTSPDCADGENCQVICTQTVPAEYERVPVKKLSEDAQVNEDPVKGKYILVSREEETEPAKYVEEEIPEVTKTFTKVVLVKDETVNETEIPAEYKTVTKRVLVKKGGLQEWREIDCAAVSADGQVLPINYYTGSSSLTATAKRIIDENLYNMLLAKPNARVEIGSHTDARGSASSNQQLSEKRAQSVVEYLVSKGIDRSRLEAKGYGETRLQNGCSDGVSCTSEQHAANRRTEFKFL